MWQVVDFGLGYHDTTLGYPFQGSERDCVAWVEAHQMLKDDGKGRYAVQRIPE